MTEINIDQIGIRQILDALPDGAYVTDTQRRVLFWNQGAERITGWQAQEVRGHSCFDNILVHEDKDGHPLCGQEHCPLHRAIVTGETSSAPLLVWAQHREGRRVPVEVTVAPLLSESGEVLGGVEVFRDLTTGAKDLQRAGLIQHHALSSPLSEDERVQFEVVYTPEDLVGGDFYRIERVDEHRYAVMLADVMGHGVASALYTMQLRSFWEDYRSLLTRPWAFVGKVNERLHCLAGEEGYFATALFLMLDASSGKIQWVRAGHSAPLLIHGNGKCEPLEGKSPALGLMPTATFSETSRLLEPQDRLLLFTDGAIETANPDGTDLGMDGLTQLLSELRFGESDVGLAELEKRLLMASGRIRLPDDLTLISIRWQGPHTP